MSDRLLEQLLDALRVLPGVGPRSAQRMALHLMERDRDGARHLAGVLARAADELKRCRSCRNLTENDVCRYCAAAGRDDAMLCVVESPADVLAIEQATGFRGRYFVLLGRLSPLDGIGPEELGLDLLGRRLEELQVEEMVIATNTTVEGEATAHYLKRMAEKRNTRVTRLAQGVPLGGELEHTDRSTLAHAFAGRQNVQ